jgi:hypothetical protein
MKYTYLGAVLVVGIIALFTVPNTAYARMEAHTVEIDGNPQTWARQNAKALDPVYDGASGPDALGDLMGFYFDQGVDNLSFRVTLYRAPGTPAETPLLGEGMRVFVLMDYMDGGTDELPYGISGTAPFMWDRGIEFTQPRGRGRARMVDARFGVLGTEQVRRVVTPEHWPNLEASIDLPEGFKAAVTRSLGEEADSYDAVAEVAAREESTPVSFYVFTASDGEVLDDIVASNIPLSNDHNVAFAHHLNQGLTYTTVFRGERGENASYPGDPNNPDDGADEILGAHDWYNLPLNWHQGGLLISAAEWHDPGFNDSLLAGVMAGRYEILSSALGQHMMPFVSDDINGKAVSVENDMINTLYAYAPRVAWVPERVWCENPDLDGNGIDASAHVSDYIGDDFTDNGIWAVILDDYVHCGYADDVFNDPHIYTYNRIKILPLDNDFVGQVTWNAGDAWNTILGGTPDEIIIYANDAEVVAEVSQGAGNPDALNNYIWLLQQCSNNSATVGVWKLTDVLNDIGFTTQPLTLQNGTYGSLGEWWGYGGGNNSWYGDWAGYVGGSNLDAHTPKWNYGAQWNHTLGKVMAGPANNLNEMGWYILMTNLHETGWHDDGEISAWQHHYSNHIRSGNAHAEAARWAGGLYVDTTGTYTADFDDDGTDELVMYNDRILAVFDPIGGKLQWLFCKGGGYNYSVVSNDNVYWVDTDGDYNETNHVAALSDVSVGGINRENDIYSFEIITPAGATVEARAYIADVEKRMSLTYGDPYLKVQYRTKGERVFVKNGFCPDNLDLTWSGKSFDRLWDPDGGGYFGYKNTNTDATGAVVVGTGGATHNFQFEATLLTGDEFYGDGSLEVYVYGGYTSPEDGMGHVPELKALRDSLVDRISPVPLGGVFYPTNDNLVLEFDEDINTSTVVVTGFGLDDDDDGMTDVTLTASDSLTTTGLAGRLSFDISPVTAAAIEALTGDIELLMAASTVEDAAGNPNEEITNIDNVPVLMAPPTKVQIDGYLPDSDWECPRLKLEDWWDSAWNGTDPGDTNEINIVFVDWDSTYLYLGIRGHVSGNSWILYLDTDVDGPDGYTDLTRIDHWERGATFTAAGFKPDYQYGAYQRQGAYDSHNLWRLTSDTTSVDMSSETVKAFDPQHTYGYDGGSEIAVPWGALFGLGTNRVPVGTVIGVVASVCWDPEPDGELGGDVAPNNVSAGLPAVDNFAEIVIDSDNDGVPDPGCGVGVPGAGPGAGTRVFHAYPSPSTSAVRVPVVLGAYSTADRARAHIKVDVFNIAGRRVATVFSGSLAAGEHLFEWDGRTVSGEAAGPGLYFMRVTVDGAELGTAKIMRIR